MTSPSEPQQAQFYGGPMDGSIYHRQPDGHFPSILHMQWEDECHVYIGNPVLRGGRWVPRYDHQGIVIVGEVT